MEAADRDAHMITAAPMRVADLQRLYDYSSWANARLLAVVSRLSDEQFATRIAGSYGSIRNTLVHVLSAEWGWLERCGGPSRGPRLKYEDYPSVETLAEAETNKRSAAPYVALQGLYSADEATRDKAFEFANKAVTRNENDSLALISLSALHGQKGDLDSVIALLSKHEAKMATDVRLANNYFEALFQSRQIEKVTKLLNALAGSPNKEVKQFAIERSRMVAQFLQQQQQQLAQAAQRK